MIQGKKILVVTTTDNMIWQFLLPHIKYLEDAGNVVECACNESGFWFKEMEKKGLVLHKIDFPRNPLSTKLIKARKSLFNLVKQNKYDLIICHQPVGGVMGRMVGHKYKIPVIYVAHGFHFFKGCPKKNLVYKAVEKHYSRYTDALVTMNEEDYQSALKFKAKRVYKINGIGFDENKYEQQTLSREDSRRALGINDEFVILTVAEMIKRKNYITMLKTIAELRNLNIKFLICGRGCELENIQNKIKELKIEDIVEILGYRKDINNIMMASDVFFLPSFQEGLTLSVIEAMSFGLPCVVSSVRGNRDLIVNAKGGFVCAPTAVESFRDKFVYLFNNRDKLSEMGKFNKEVSKKYKYENVVEEMKKIYEEIEFYDDEGRGY